MECCGEPFEVGSRVEWLTGRRDSDWFESILGSRDAARITDAVDQHGSSGESRMTGVVRAIDAVACRYEQLDGALVMTPVRGSGILRRVSAIDGWKREDDGETFVGWALDVEVDPAEEV